MARDEINAFLGAGTTYQGTLNFQGSVQSSPDGFHMDGTVEAEGPVTDKRVFRDVVICLYTEDDQLLYTTSPADLPEPGGKVNVSLTINETPKYIVINSTDFWDVSGLAVTYYSREVVEGETLFPTTRVDSPDKLPVRGCTAYASAS